MNQTNISTEKSETWIKAKIVKRFEMTCNFLVFFHHEIVYPIKHLYKWNKLYLSLPFNKNLYHIFMKNSLIKMRIYNEIEVKYIQIVEAFKMLKNLLKEPPNSNRS